MKMGTVAARARNSIRDVNSKGGDMETRARESYSARRRMPRQRRGTVCLMIERKGKIVEKNSTGSK